MDLYMYCTDFTINIANLLSISYYDVTKTNIGFTANDKILPQIVSLVCLFSSVQLFPQISPILSY